MKTGCFVIVLALAAALFQPPTATAFECPVHLQNAQGAIDKATAAMKGMAKGEKMSLVHTLIDDAKMLLVSGKHNHEKPQGAYDHARAIAKAKSARGYAEAAEVLARQM